MAKEYDSKKMDKLVTFIKKQGVGNYTEPEAAAASGVERGIILRYLVKAELIADPKLKVPATPAGILKAKKSGLRWPRVAAYAGISVSEAKELFAEAGGTEDDEYTGRGRRSGTSTSTGVRTTSKSKSKSKAAPAATSGRRGAAKRSSTKTKTAPAATRGRRGTRAGARSADPS